MHQRPLRTSTRRDSHRLSPWGLFVCLFIYLWLCWVFVSVRGLSPVAASGGHSSSRCAGLSPSRPLLLWSTGSRRAGSVVVRTGLVAPRHVGSSRTRAWTRVPCVGRQTLNHCASRETLSLGFWSRTTTRQGCSCTVEHPFQHFHQLILF